MKVKLLTSLSLSKASHGAGETVELKDLQAYRLISAGLAEPTNKKQFDAFLKKLKEEEQKKAEEEAKRKAMLERERIEAELNGLYLQVVEKEAELAGVVLSDEEKLRLVEELKNRETKAGNEAKNNK